MICDRCGVDRIGGWSTWDDRRLCLGCIVDAIQASREPLPIERRLHDYFHTNSPVDRCILCRREVTA